MCVCSGSHSLTEEPGSQLHVPTKAPSKVRGLAVFFLFLPPLSRSWCGASRHLKSSRSWRDPAIATPRNQKWRRSCCQASSDCTWFNLSAQVLLE